MPIDLLPIISWIKQDVSVSYSYDDSLDEILSAFRPSAKILLVRYAPPEKGGCEPADLVHKALFSLQQKIFDQYLPPLERQRVRSVGCIWPWWESAGMKVVLDSGKVHPLSPLPSGNGALHQCEVDGFTYQYKFYRNDSEEQRRRWVYQALEDEARKEGRDAVHKAEVQIDDDREFVDTRSDPSPGECELKDWLAISDLDDWRICLRESLGDDQTQRKQRSRAKARLVAAYNILCHPSSPGASKTFLERLKQVKDGERKPILDEYLRRYPDESRVKTRG